MADAYLNSLRELRLEVLSGKLAGEPMTYKEFMDRMHDLWPDVSLPQSVMDKGQEILNDMLSCTK